MATVMPSPTLYVRDLNDKSFLTLDIIGHKNVFGGGRARDKLRKEGGRAAPGVAYSARRVPGVLAKALLVGHFLA